MEPPNWVDFYHLLRALRTALPVFLILLLVRFAVHLRPALFRALTFRFAMILEDAFND
jgi:hypothetical protein